MSPQKAVGDEIPVSVVCAKEGSPGAADAPREGSEGDGVRIILSRSIGSLDPDSRLVVLDQRCMDGPVPVAALAARARCPDAEIALIADHPDIALDVEVMKAALFEVLTPPVDRAKIVEVAKAVRERSESQRENKEIRQLLEEYKLQTIISHSPDIEKVLSLAARAAASDATVLIRGESGTGKELIARAIHLASPRKGRQFVAVNIAALSENLIESELFGHAKGSFTGAMADRAGRFEQADGGTLFIDEIGDVPPGIQVKLLRVLQFGTCERVGENRQREANVRIIAATNRSLEDDIESGRFRADLYYRVNVIPIRIPPLREHMEDVPYLVEHFMKKYNEKNGKGVKGIALDAMAKLMRHRFPGNVRELENIIERGIVLCRGDYVTETDILLEDYQRVPRETMLTDNADLTGDGQAFASGEHLDVLEAADADEAPDIDDDDGEYVRKMREYERTFLRIALKASRWNRSAAARALGITERRLRNRLKVLGMERDA